MKNSGMAYNSIERHRTYWTQRKWRWNL